MTVASAYETTNEIAGNISGIVKLFETVTLELLSSLSNRNSVD